jgi:hypothetical protein
MQIVREVTVRSRSIPNAVGECRRVSPMGTRNLASTARVGRAVGTTVSPLPPDPAQQITRVGNSAESVSSVGAQRWVLHRPPAAVKTVPVIEQSREANTATPGATDVGVSFPGSVWTSEDSCRRNRCDGVDQNPWDLPARHVCSARARCAAR